MGAEKRPRHLSISLLDFELCVADVFLAWVLRFAVAGRLGAGSRPAWSRLLGIEMLRHRMGGLLELVDRLPNGVDVILAGNLLDTLDRGLDRCLVGIGDLVLV